MLQIWYNLAYKMRYHKIRSDFGTGLSFILHSPSSPPGPAAEYVDHYVAGRPDERRPSEDYDHLYDRRARPRRAQQNDHAQSGERAGVHVAGAVAPSLERLGQGLLRQHLRRPVPLLARVPGQHAPSCHHSSHRQVGGLTVLKQMKCKCMKQIICV